MCVDRNIVKDAAEALWGWVGHSGAGWFRLAQSSKGLSHVALADKKRRSLQAKPTLETYKQVISHIHANTCKHGCMLAKQHTLTLTDGIQAGT